jgi:predicted AAA+ superfamily ATPase
LSTEFYASTQRSISPLNVMNHIRNHFDLLRIINYIHNMNNYNSSPEIYYERWITQALREAVQNHPVVVLTGARQVGKSTLLLTAEPFRSWRYRTLDAYDVLDQAKREPESLWGGTDRIILDEVQKAPDLLQAVKMAVDQKPGKYRFVLSGSANLLLMHRVSESLAGRAVYFVLDPMCMGEIHRLPPPDILPRLLAGHFPEEGALSEEPEDPLHLIMRGFLPPLLTLSKPESWVRWWEGYVATYLERDLRQVSQIDALLDFRRMMELLALRSGQLLNQSEIARDAGLTQPTVHRYLNVLETTYLFERLRPYMKSRTTRILKSPKIFFNDPGLAIFLSGFYTPEDLQKAREYGSFFETFVYHHLRVQARLMNPSGRVFFWRTRSGIEVDFIIQHGRRIVAVEVKNTKNPGFHDAAGLRSFLDEHGEAEAGILVHRGREIIRLSEKIVALPFSLLTG